RRAVALAISKAPGERPARPGHPRRADGREARHADDEHRIRRQSQVMRRPLRIRVRGSGLAALAAAKLLVDRGADVIIDAPTRRRNRIVAVAIETLALAADLFDVDPRELAIGPTVSGRRVDWSADGPGLVPQSAVVCRGD